MSPLYLVVIVLVVFVIVSLPRWGYHSYGYAPSGILGVVLVILLVLLLLGRL